MSTSLTRVRTSDAVFGDVDETVGVEGHVLDGLKGTVFISSLRNVSVMRLV